ncbi:MAG: hypothetical protein ACP5N3_05250 [Candidatus Nanoarchaeia archaeon]
MKSWNPDPVYLERIINDLKRSVDNAPEKFDELLIRGPGETMYSVNYLIRQVKKGTSLGRHLYDCFVADYNIMPKPSDISEFEAAEPVVLLFPYDAEEKQKKLKSLEEYIINREEQKDQKV